MDNVERKDKKLDTKMKRGRKKTGKERGRS